MNNRRCALLTMLLMSYWISVPSAYGQPADKIPPLHHDLRIALSTSAFKRTAANGVAIPKIDNVNYVVWHMEFVDTPSCRQFKPPEGLFLFHRFERFADAFAALPDENRILNEFAKHPELRWLDLGGVVRIPPPPKPTPIDGKARAIEKIVAGGHRGRTGKGVIIAIIDSGIDFRHQDFIASDKDGQPLSRLRRYWDTVQQPAEGQPGRAASIKYPNGVPIGVIYTQEELTADLRSEKPKIKNLDFGGHGTACAGIAAGNGSSLEDKRYVGVAPEAEIIGVRIGSYGMENAFLLNAICAWLDKEAGDRPLVVSCSFGGQYGGHDSCLVKERQLAEQFTAEKKGRALCIAAGNDALQKIHARAMFDDKTPGEITWAAPQGGMIEIYVSAKSGKGLSIEMTDLVHGKGSNRYVNPLSNSYVLRILLEPTPKDEMGRLKLVCKGEGKCVADAYIFGPPAKKPTEAVQFTGPCLSTEGLVGAPGSCSAAITVGSYDFNEIFDAGGKLVRLSSFNQPLELGKLSIYSSPGYLRDGTVKPDVVAPGQYFTAPASKQTPAEFLDTTKKYQLFNGTSAATPYTAGVVALMFEKSPQLTFGAAKQLLKDNLHRGSEIVPQTPHPHWGYGKLDYQAIDRVIKALK